MVISVELYDWVILSGNHCCGNCLDRRSHKKASVIWLVVWLTYLRSKVNVTNDPFHLHPMPSDYCTPNCWLACLLIQWSCFLIDLQLVTDDNFLRYHYRLPGSSNPSHLPQNAGVSRAGSHIAWSTHQQRSLQASLSSSTSAVSLGQVTRLLLPTTGLVYPTLITRNNSVLTLHPLAGLKAAILKGWFNQYSTASCQMKLLF